jgi:hypothetical protein
LRASENRVLRRLFPSKRQEVTDWRIIHNEELHNLQALPGIIRVIKSGAMRWEGTCSSHAQGEKFVQNDGGKT